MHLKYGIRLKNGTKMSKNKDPLSKNNNKAILVLAEN